MRNKRRINWWAKETASHLSRLREQISEWGILIKFGIIDFCRNLEPNDSHYQ